VKRLVYSPFKNLVFNRRKLPVFNITEQDLEHQWRYLQKYQPKFMSGFSSSLYRLASYIQDMGYDGGLLGVKLMTAGGEVLYDFQRETIERVFQCPLADVYGSFEIGIAACSYPCGALHTHDDFVIVEMVKEHPQDEFGQIVATRLDNWEFPLIRFNVEDLAPPLEEHRDCSLGLNFLKLDRIVGRVFDRIFLANGQEIHGTFFTALMKRTPGICRYQVNQRRPDCLEILVVIDEGIFTGEQERFIGDRIHALFGPLEVIITRVETIPTDPSGKFRIIRSDLALRRPSGSNTTFP
jgi:phenylacetate-CoA ligase